MHVCDVNSRTLSCCRFRKTGWRAGTSRSIARRGSYTWCSDHLQIQLVSFPRSVKHHPALDCAAYFFWPKKGDRDGLVVKDGAGVSSHSVPSSQHHTLTNVTKTFGGGLLQCKGPSPLCTTTLENELQPRWTFVWFSKTEILLFLSDGSQPNAVPADGSRNNAEPVQIVVDDESQEDSENMRFKRPSRPEHQKRLSLILPKKRQRVESDSSICSVNDEPRRPNFVYGECNSPKHRLHYANFPLLIKTRQWDVARWQ